MTDTPKPGASPAPTPSNPLQKPADLGPATSEIKPSNPELKPHEIGKVDPPKTVQDILRKNTTQSTPESLDYATADAAAVHSALGIDIGGLAKDPQVLMFLIDLANKLIGLFKRKPKAEAPPPVVVITPNGPAHVPPPPVTPPGPPQEPPVEARLITSLRAKFYHISRQNRTLPKDEFDRIVSRQDPLQRGDRVHLDISPFDQYGREIGPGSPELEQLVRRWETTDPATGETEQHQELRLRWLQPQDGVGEITNEYDDYGMTPVYKVPKNLEIGQQYELGSFALEFIPAGQSRGVVSNELPSLRIRPWQE